MQLSVENTSVEEKQTHNVEQNSAKGLNMYTKETLTKHINSLLLYHYSTRKREKKLFIKNISSSLHPSQVYITKEK